MHQTKFLLLRWDSLHPWNYSCSFFVTADTVSVECIPTSCNTYKEVQIILELDPKKICWQGKSRSHCAKVAITQHSHKKQQS